MMPCKLYSDNKKQSDQWRGMASRQSRVSLKGVFECLESAKIAAKFFEG